MPPGEPDSFEIASNDTMIAQFNSFTLKVRLGVAVVSSIALLAAGIPCELSLTAGAYLCNQVFYTLMDHLTTQGQDIPAGFIHLPSLPEQVALRGTNQSSMALDLQVQAIRIVLQTVSIQKVTASVAFR